MIRNDREYQNTVERIADFKNQIEAITQQMSNEGFGSDDIDLATAGTKIIIEQLVWERDFYDHLRSDEVSNSRDSHQKQQDKR